MPTKSRDILAKTTLFFWSNVAGPPEGPTWPSPTLRRLADGSCSLRAANRVLIVSRQPEEASCAGGDDATSEVFVVVGA